MTRFWPPPALASLIIASLALATSGALLWTREPVPEGKAIPATTITVTSTVTVVPPGTPAAAESAASTTTAVAPLPPVRRTPSPASTTTSTATTTAATRPRGQAFVLAPIKDGYGQGFSSGSCANWHVRVDNGTNVELTGLTFRASSGELSNADYSKTRPARRPAEVRVSLSVEAHHAQDVNFQSCSATAVPDGWEYNDLPPTTVNLTWLNGFASTVCFIDC